MADLYGKIELSEWRNARVTLTPQAPATTITISSATCTIKDAPGAVAGGVSAATATFDTGAQAAPRVWYLLKPSVLGLTAGRYTISFLILDSTGFKWEPVISFRVVDDNS